MEFCESDTCSSQLGAYQKELFSASFYFGLCALISHGLLLGITVVIAHKCISLKLEHTAGHAFYCTVGFVFCLGESLLVQQSKLLKLWLSSFSLDLLHSALILLAFGIGVVGVGIKTWQKLQRKRDDPKAQVLHFRSNHGFSGIIGCVLLLCCLLSDLALYLFASKSLQLLHRFFTISSFVALMTSQLFGYKTGFASRQWKAHHVRWFQLLTFVVTVTTINYEFRLFSRELVAHLT
ncbi:uncharacterized protein LOC108603575 [Drosophila busckii]|uniref:uncharacterized protein LOC108603575 n=1 Tax=Drosophila busckii TaxID=30019 RepID=UPI001432BE99|nr:uncharacterized protein LOC108603575 [Drosophila busckii]